MLIAIFVTLLLNVAGLLFLACAVGNLSIGVANLHTRLIDEFNALAELETGLHRLTRRYVGHELIFKRLFPHLGLREPAKTVAEKWALDTWRKEVENVQQEQTA